jgi:chemotaxis-related protein WspD
LGTAEDNDTGNELSVLVFRLSDEWLALPVSVLVEVTSVTIIHRIPHRRGLISGIVNIRGELHVCIRLDLLIGVGRNEESIVPDNPRLIVVRQDLDVWVFAVDEVDQVHRVPIQSLVPAAPTLARAATKMNKGVFQFGGNSVGLLDEAKLFHAIREKTR